MATLAESFMADLADLSDDSGSEDEAPAHIIDGEDLLVSARISVCHGTESKLTAIPPQSLGGLPVGTSNASPMSSENQAQ